MTTLRDKVRISISSALLFLAVNLPQTYQLTNNLSPVPLINPATNCPTNLGLLSHTLVFFVVSFITMGDPTKKTALKIKHSLYGSLIMFLLSNPVSYTLTGSLFGPQIATNGCPTLIGVILHSIVYCVALVGVMYLPDE